MKRLAIVVAAGALVGVGLVPAAQAAPPEPPLSCQVIPTVPASDTGTAQALANKVAAYERVCGFAPPGY